MPPHGTESRQRTDLIIKNRTEDLSKGIQNRDPRALPNPNKRGMNQIAAITKQGHPQMDPSLKKTRIPILDVLPTILCKLILLENVLHYLGALANRTKIIKWPTLHPPGLEGEPLINNQPHKTHNL
jgi:hypothetical protein